MNRAVCLALAVLTASCGRYAEFTLPKLDAQSGQVSWSWETAPEPVQRRLSDWERVDALNPSVVHNGTEYINLYSGYDGQSWHTGVSTSADGLHWRQLGRILSPDPKTWEGDYIAANGTAVLHDGQYFYWYQGGLPPRIGLAKSSDYRRLNRHGEPVLDLGPRGSWDERGVADPYVIVVDGVFYMYYLGQDRARRQRLGVARSEDGVHWEKHRGNPILELGEPGAFDETGLGEPAVWRQHGSYWMLYTARDRHEVRRLGLARSQDGVQWTRVTTKPVFTGEQPWNSKVVCDPTVMVSGDRVRMWYGGGDRAEPAENLNGQIGYAVLRLRVGD